MSLDATRWAWEQQGLKPSTKLVLLSLADRAGEDHVCYPSTRRLEMDTGLYRETIYSATQELEKMGLIISEKQNGKSNRYRLIGVTSRHNQSAKADGLNRSENTDQSLKADSTSTEKPTTTSRQKPTQNLSVEPTKNLFDVFWSFWPRREAKAKAIKAMNKIGPTEALINQIRLDVERRIRLGHWADPKFIPHPATYLAGRRWEDEPNATPPDGGQPRRRLQPL